MKTKNQCDSFAEAGLGLFIHYGHYAAAGWDASWSLVGGVKTLPKVMDVAVEAYHANARRFAPKANAAQEWAAAAARMGARYAVLTTRHHDGFALWPSQAPGAFTVASIGLERDIVAEFCLACRQHGLKVGLYYSLSDWKHSDYPAFEERHKPYAWGQNPRPSAAQWDRFRAYLIAQITELMTHYGEIAMIWFDGGWERSAEQWGVEELEGLMRRLQPGLLINDRLPGRGDYATPEQFVPATPPEGLWESCLTMNTSWGANAQDNDYKSATGLIHALCETRGRGGNLLLNVGPEGDGSVPEAQTERIDAIAAWMDSHGVAIHGAKAGLAPWQFYGPSTRAGDTTYCMLTMRPTEPVSIRGIPVKRVRTIRLLGQSAPLPWRPRLPVMEELFSPDPIGEVLVDLKDARLDPHCPIIALQMMESA